jgi:hypothetical protein
VNECLCQGGVAPLTPCACRGLRPTVQSCALAYAVLQHRTVPLLETVCVRACVYVCVCVRACVRVRVPHRCRAPPYWTSGSAMQQCV